MTKVGSAVLSEYISEIKEHIEDDKTRIRVGQALSTGHSFWRLGALAVNLFFLGCLTLSVLLLFFVDAEMLDALRSATNEDVLSAINSFLNFTLMVAMLTFICYLFFAPRRYFRDLKQERLEREQERSLLIQTIIEVNEELLLRHGLIVAEERK
jgi:ABC-type Fe3+ transport system permease subunit